MHVLERTAQGIRVAAHIPIPSALNAVNINYRTALLNSGRGGTTILRDGDGTAGTIGSVEKANIVAGSVYEVIVTLPLDVPILANVGAFLDAEFTRLTAEVQAELAQTLRYYGATR